MFARIVLLFGLLVATNSALGHLVAGDHHLQDRNHKDTGIQAPPPFAPSGISPDDVLLKEDSEGAWIAAAFIALAIHKGNPLGKHLHEHHAHDGINSTDLHVHMWKYQYNDKFHGKTFYTQTGATPYSSFNATSYWWPNAVVKAALDMGGFPGIQKHHLATGNASDVFYWFDVEGQVLFKDQTSQRDLVSTLTVNHTEQAVVIATNNQTGKGPLKPLHAYAVTASIQNQQFDLRDPMSKSSTTYQVNDSGFKDLVDQIDTISYSK